TTKAEFKQFRVAKEMPPLAVPAAVAARIKKAAQGLKPGTPPDAEMLGKLSREGPASLAVLRERARKLEEEAARLKQLAGAGHAGGVEDELAEVLGVKKGPVDLLHAALLIAKLDNDELDVDAYRRDVDRRAKRIAAKLPKDADDKTKLAALNKYLFEERGFHG